MSLDMQQGKRSFQAGDYKNAFHCLLPVAARGNRDAQYAVGYMYYYGYGVSEDSESGIFWMERSAEQNFEPARKALNLIRQNDTEVLKERAQKNEPDQRDEIMQAARIQREQTAPPIVVTPRRLQRTSAVMSENVEKKTQPLLSENSQNAADQVMQPRNFALQLYGSYHLTDVKDLQTRLRLKNTGHIYQTSHNGKDWYVLTFGNFMTVNEAAATKNNLPGGLKELDPWVRKVDSLRLV